MTSNNTNQDHAEQDHVNLRIELSDAEYDQLATIAAAEGITMPELAARMINGAVRDV
ncbi:hypothetical protein [Corynebacterium variabile]|uniref:hypothetical protein n=1 Tax=Corynebacterium variabile TaxID=1727 RepID=UPI0028A95626|nr:hypothetical protein [Corynebacterium variabile]